ncbi:MAG: hypothetical protein ACTSUE_23350 [Promethearchaeota archaeon]
MDKPLLNFCMACGAKFPAPQAGTLCASCIAKTGPVPGNRIEPGGTGNHDKLARYCLYCGSLLFGSRKTKCYSCMKDLPPVGT